jgi:hypothetical protein
MQTAFFWRQWGGGARPPRTGWDAQLALPNRLRRMTTLDRAEAVFVGFLRVAAACLLIWASGIVVLQGLGWLRYAECQPVPLWALFLSPEAQSFNLRMFEEMPNALYLAPPLGTAGDAEVLVLAIAGRFVGIQVLVSWLIDVALSIWCLSAATVMLIWAAVLDAPAPGRL